MSGSSHANTSAAPGGGPISGQGRTTNQWSQPDACSMRLSFSAWARTLALAGAYFAVNGGVVDYFYTDPSAALGIACGTYSIVVGLVVVLFLYPVKLGPLWLGPILRIVHFNYAPVGVVLVLLGPFCAVVVPTVMAGALLVLSGCMYIVAGIRRERGTPLKELTWGKPSSSGVAAS